MFDNDGKVKRQPGERHRGRCLYSVSARLAPRLILTLTDVAGAKAGHRHGDGADQTTITSLVQTHDLLVQAWPNYGHMRPVWAF